MTSLFVDEETIDIRAVDKEPSSAPDQEPSPGASDGADLWELSSLPERFDLHPNPLINISHEVIAVLAALPRLGYPQDIRQFRLLLLDLVAEVRNRGLFLDYHASVIDKTCFVLCAALDETIMNTDWGEAANWGSNTLVSSVFNQRNGGEVFFDLLDQALRQQMRLVDFLEVQYCLLQLGFRGRYRDMANSPVSEFSASILKLLFRHHKDTMLPEKSREKPVSHGRPFRFIPFSWLLLGAATLMAITVMISELWYGSQSAVLLSQYERLAMEVFYTDTGQDEAASSVQDDETSRLLRSAGVLTGQLFERVWSVTLTPFERESRARAISNELTHAGYLATVTQVRDKWVVKIPATSRQKAELLKNELGIRYNLTGAVELDLLPESGTEWVPGE
ncbi:hypothetical protein GCM10023116_14460 [Kistimonas scapharcae]|uniref:Type IV / VI secretion system DotU domain-containing protein n=1 Tax=Kistimonas scapharcae TaxID=1036133 RepID=A0ABP8V2U9_9GAMM